MMKAIYKIFLWLAVMAVGFMGACNQDTALYGNEENVPEVLAITLSAEDVTLLPDMAPNDEVFTVAWNEAAERGPYDEIEYVFKMDLTDNAFAAGTTYREEIPAGVFSKAITYQLLYDLLTEEWRVTLGSTVSIDVRVIATVHGPKFVRPEVSTVRISVKIFMPDPKPLYIMGTAVPDGGSNTNYAAKKIKMEETVPGKEYTFNDSLTAGDFIFVTDDTNPATLLPAYEKGADNATLVYLESGTPSNRFTAINGQYSITVRLDHLTARINKKAVINGIEWAPANVDSNGKFADTPDAPGKYYQFLGTVGYSDTDEWLGVNGAGEPEDKVWSSQGSPCPEGYSLLDEWTYSGGDLQTALTALPRTYRAAGTAGNAVNGIFIGPDSPTATISSTGNAVFIPFAGYRDPQTGTLTEYGQKAYIHTGNPYYGVSSQIIVIDATSVTWNRQKPEEPSSTYNWGMGASIRCIKR
jgi:hypothetical protein